VLADKAVCIERLQLISETFSKTPNGETSETYIKTSNGETVSKTANGEALHKAVPRVVSVFTRDMEGLNQLEEISFCTSVEPTQSEQVENRCRIDFPFDCTSPSQEPGLSADLSTDSCDQRSSVFQSENARSDGVDGVSEDHEGNTSLGARSGSGSGTLVWPGEASALATCHVSQSTSSSLSADHLQSPTTHGGQWLEPVRALDTVQCLQAAAHLRALQREQPSDKEQAEADQAPGDLSATAQDPSRSQREETEARSSGRSVPGASSRLPGLRTGSSGSFGAESSSTSTGSSASDVPPADGCRIRISDALRPFRGTGSDEEMANPNRSGWEWPPSWGHEQFHTTLISHQQGTGW
jgi:hypothetical protein